MALGKFTLTGNFPAYDDTPKAGTVRIVGLPAAIIDADGKKVYTAPGRPLALTSGAFSIELVTDVTEGESAAIGFRVTVSPHDAPAKSVEFYAQPAGSTLDFSEVATHVVAVVTPDAASATDLLTLEASLAPVATTGAYTDLTGTPTIPATAADVGADPAGSATAAQTAAATYTDTAVAPKQDAATLEADVAARVGTDGALDVALSASYVATSDTEAGRALFPLPRLRGDAIDSYIARPAGSPASRSPVEWKHDDTAGYLFHLTGASGMGGSAALVGLGVDAGGTGLFINNKATGVGLMVTQNDTITSALAHGIRINASSTVAPALWFGQGKAAAKAARFTSNVVPGASQRLVEFFTTTTTASDTEIGYIRADNGDLVWSKGTIVGGEGLRSEGPTAVFTLYGTGGTTTANQRRFNLSTAYGLFIISAKTDAGGSAGDVLYIKHSNGDITPKDGASIVAGTTTGLKVGGAATQKLGFYGAAPVVKPTGVAVDAAGIHAALVSLGLIGA